MFGVVKAHRREGGAVQAPVHAAQCGVPVEYLRASLLIAFDLSQPGLQSLAVTAVYLVGQDFLLEAYAAPRLHSS